MGTAALYRQDLYREREKMPETVQGSERERGRKRERQKRWRERERERKREREKMQETVQVSDLKDLTPWG